VHGTERAKKIYVYDTWTLLKVAEAPAPSIAPAPPEPAIVVTGTVWEA
jgi:hypothetical protein